MKRLHISVPLEFDPDDPADRIAWATTAVETDPILAAPLPTDPRTGKGKSRPAGNAITFTIGASPTGYTRGRL